MSDQHRQRGFTLIEMMISMFLGLIILGGTITAYQAISSVREQRDVLYQLQDELLYVHRALASSVKVAESISIEAGNNGSKLSLKSSEAMQGVGLSKIKCPGLDEGNKQVKWLAVNNASNRQALKCKPGDGGAVKVIPLVLKGNVGIASIGFCTLPHEIGGECNSGESDSGVFVKIDYYDHRCDPADKSCHSKTLFFHLATRDFT
ncbi:PilW family protein [Chromohalobacter israelensis]|uniref:PilW family protein n=1 Tax=Chromohalobacter israelensis TaxID=141390 RepID=UPI0013E8A27B|nr:prepilin-type N-terminal cleavage/methylation domain-containing protein [Chromohalobacter salexigens]